MKNNSSANFESWDLPFVSGSEIKIFSVKKLVEIMMASINRMLKQEKNSGRDLKILVWDLIERKKKQLLSETVSSPAIREMKGEMDLIFEQHLRYTTEGDRYYSCSQPNREVMLAALHVVSAFVMLKPNEKNPNRFIEQTAGFFKEMAVWVGQSIEYQFPFRSRDYSKIDLSKREQNKKKAINAILVELQRQRKQVSTES